MDHTQNTPDGHQPVPASTTTHIYVLLDRSGSMSAIRDDVVGGFNVFLAEQRADGEDARITLVQFDTGDPADVLVDDIPVREMVDLTPAAYVPRGGTPLLDATGLVVARAQERTAARPEPGEVVVVTITDGHENSSREFTRRQIRDLVAEREAEGWTFVFLSAGLDAYDEAHGTGYHQGSVQSFAPDAAGTAAAFGSLSRAMAGKRAQARRGEARRQADFWQGEKPAEADRRRKRDDGR